MLEGSTGAYIGCFMRFSTIRTRPARPTTWLASSSRDRPRKTALLLARDATTRMSLPATARDECSTRAVYDLAAKRPFERRREASLLPGPREGHAFVDDGQLGVAQ